LSSTVPVPGFDPEITKEQPEGRSATGLKLTEQLNKRKSRTNRLKGGKEVQSEA